MRSSAVQAFFRRGTPDAWSFNSARKFFGVPDGAFLYGPATGIEPLPPSDNDDCEHLLTRIAGNDGLAWSQFKAHEARIGIEPRAISSISAMPVALSIAPLQMESGAPGAQMPWWSRWAE